MLAAKALSRLFSGEIQKQHEVGNVRPGRAGEDQIAGFFKKRFANPDRSIRVNNPVRAAAAFAAVSLSAIWRRQPPRCPSIRAEGNEDLLVWMNFRACKVRS